MYVKFIECVDDALNSVRHIKDEKKSLCLAKALSSRGFILSQNTGHWIGKPLAGYCNVRCSVCETVFLANSGKWKFCPECGSKIM